MNKKIKYFIIVVLGFLSFSCQKDQLNGDYMKASINGEAYKPVAVSAYFSSNSNKTTLNIKSNTDKGKTLNLIINGYDGPKTYNFKSGPLGKRALCTYSYMIENGTIYTFVTEDADDNGEITITSLEGSKVEGSFNFRAYSADKGEYITVSGGSFRANF